MKEELQNMIKAKRVYKTGSGVEFRYDFVPALANIVFAEYIQKSSDLTPKILEIQKIMRSKRESKDIFKDEVKIDKWNAEAKEIQVEAEYVNALGLKIIMMILTRNPQPIEVTEENVMLEMDTADMVEFIQTSCNASPDQKKR
jgi:hypothetical protein